MNNEVESIQWADTNDNLLAFQERMAKRIVLWIRRNGGDAQYLPDGAQWTAVRSTPCIAIRTVVGSVYANPGDTIVKGYRWYRHPLGYSLREFTVRSEEPTP